VSDERLGLYKGAQLAIQTGDRTQAAALLKRLLRHHPREYRAWLWLSGVAETPQESLRYARLASRINGDDPGVIKALRWAEKRASQDSAAATQEAIQATAQEAAPASPKPKRSRWGLIAVSALVLTLLAVAAGSWAIWGSDLFTAGSDPVANAPAVVRGEVSDVEEGPTPTTEASVTDTRTDVTEPVADPATATSTALPPTPTAPPPTSLAEAIPPKDIAQADRAGQPRPTWTATPLPTNTPVPTPTPLPATPIPAPADTGRTIPIADGEHWIDVNLSTQTMTAFIGNDPVYHTLVSSGLPQWPTVTGQFRIYLAYESQNMSGAPYGYDYYLPNVPHVMYFYEGYALHGAYWHTNFGTQQSHGCVNLALHDAAWVWEFASIGTLVNVHY
jgi:lipoprotein-anchoring transpeptidase ErfK/SrfK